MRATDLVEKTFSFAADVVDDAVVLYNKMTAVFQNNNRNTVLQRNSAAKSHYTHRAASLKAKAVRIPFTSVILIHLRCFCQFL